MLPGDYSSIAKIYKYRPSYNEKILTSILKQIEFEKKLDFKVVEVGAGTGKFTKLLLEKGLNVIAVEPNDEMREIAVNSTQNNAIKWIKGTGEHTTIESNTADWVVIASAFHWTDYKLSLPEFYRILKDAGFLTVLWITRDTKNSLLEKKIENIIYNIAPYLKKISPSSTNKDNDWDKIIVSTGHFKDVVKREVSHHELRSKYQYIEAWKSVCYLRTQVNENDFHKIIYEIEKELKHIKEIDTPYKIKSWTAQKF